METSRAGACGRAKCLGTLYWQVPRLAAALCCLRAGEERVSRLLKTRAEKSFATIEAALPVETPMYVPKILAVNSVREGMDVRSLPVRAPPLLFRCLSNRSAEWARVKSCISRRITRFFFPGVGLLNRPLHGLFRIGCRLQLQVRMIFADERP